MNLNELDCEVVDQICMVHVLKNTVNDIWFHKRREVSCPAERPSARQE